MKKLILYFTIIVLFSNLVGFIGNTNLASAQTQKPLEVTYPTIPGVTAPGPGITIPDYVKYIFHFIIWISGFVALGVLIYAGFQYFTSTGDPTKMQDSKDRIFSALLGLVILFGSYLILTTINPQLVILHIEPATSIITTLRAGSLACKEQVDVSTAWSLSRQSSISESEKTQLESIFKKISEKCYTIDSESYIREDFDKSGNYIQYIYLIPDSSSENRKTYGIIVYEDKNFKGKAKVLTQTSQDQPQEEGGLGSMTISSARPFILLLQSSPTAGSKAVLYEDINFNFGGTSTAQGKKIQDISSFACYNTTFVPQSVEIKGDLIVVLSTGQQFGEGGETDVFTDPGDFDLNSGRLACWQWCGWWPCKKSCVKSGCTYFATFIY